ncbi:hypothetical protein BC941DRAFT_517451 [Chlamydoabsidia padenii]|nr:hypothetical protein BC941DRAFT_517451 [Chlamydoabsidia padenii]
MSLSVTSSPSSHSENNDDFGNFLERYCNRCRKSCPVALFAGRRVDYKTCLNCRNRGTPVPVCPDFGEFIPIEQLADSFDNSPSLDTDIIFDGHLFIDDGHIDNTDEQLIDAIYLVVEHAGGFRYTKKNIANPKKRHSVAFLGLCAQRTDVNKQRPPNELVRLGQCMTTYDCGGELSGVIYRQQRWITLTVKHQEQHEPHNEDEHPSMPIEVREFITTHAHQLTSGDLFAQVQRQFGRADDQMVSSRILVREYQDAGFRERIMTLVNNDNNDNYSSDYLAN